MIEPGIYLLSVAEVALETSRVTDRLFAKVRFSVLAPPGAGSDALFDTFSLQPPPGCAVTLGMVLFERFLRAALNNPMTSLTEILYQLTDGGHECIQPENAQRLLHDRLRGCEVLARVALRERELAEHAIVTPVIKQYWPKEDAKRKAVK